MLHKERQQHGPEEKAIQSLEKSVRGYQEALKEIEKVKSMKISRTESSEFKMDAWAKKDKYKVREKRNVVNKEIRSDEK